MNSKMTTNSQLSTTEPKKQNKNKNKNKLSKLLEQEQNHRNGDHMEGFQWRGGGVRAKVQGIRSINSRYKIGRGMLRIVWEMEKPKNLYIRPVDMN